MIDTTPAADDTDLRTMRAVLHPRYADTATEALDVGRAPLPTVSPGTVLVRVEAASIDRGTWHVMTGLPYPVRLAGFGFRRPKHLNPGAAFAGVVESVGAEVEGFTPGDRVYGTAPGAFAEYALAPAAKLAHAPAGLSAIEAATLPISASTALQAVVDQAGLQPGESVLVMGASGGVGSFAVQIAWSIGAEVTGVASGPKLAAVRSMGAAHVVDHRTEDALAEADRYDVIIDIGGNRRLRDLRRALTPAGRLVITGGENGGRWLGGTDRQLRAMAWSLFLRQRLGTFIASEAAEHLDRLTELVEASSLSPHIDRVVGLDDVPAAIDHLLDGTVIGKIAVDLTA
ncbi:MAG: NAD(P)-dependent alcohol dehydrogenase [Actinomycetota bacterium]